MARIYENLDEMKETLMEDGFDYLTKLEGYYELKKSEYEKDFGAAHLFCKRFGDLYVFKVVLYSGPTELEHIPPQYIKIKSEDGSFETKLVNARYLRKGMSPSFAKYSYFNFPVYNKQ